jgi:hypothetical protein
MHVFGLNMAGEVGALKAISEKIFHSIGYRIEAALIVPQESTLEIQRDNVSIGGIVVPAGEYDYDGDGAPGGPRPRVIDGRAFAKWVVGLDYTFNEHVYSNVQWVHGMPDEFGGGDFLREGYVVGAAGVSSDPVTTLACAVPNDALGLQPKDPSNCAHERQRPRIADYLVWGFDVKALQQKLLFRVFTIFALNGVRETYFDPEIGGRVTKHHSMFTKDGFSAVLYPEINYNFGNGLDLGAGVLAQMGKDWTKFGDPATGGTIAWGRGRFAF